MDRITLTTHHGTPWSFEVDQKPTPGQRSRTFIGTGTAPGARVTLYRYARGLYMARLYGERAADAPSVHVSASTLQLLLRRICDACDESAIASPDPTHSHDPREPDVCPRRSHPSDAPPSSLLPLLPPLPLDLDQMALPLDDLS